MKIIWSGLADAKYFEFIAQYCLPSWKKLPGEKYIVHDDKIINYNFINVVDWETVVNFESQYWVTYNNGKKKTNSFWKKMQSQVWAVRNLTNCDILVLLDTDIEILKFDKKKFNAMLEDFVNSEYVWATGQSQRKGHDSGFIVFNMQHPKLQELINYYENIWDSGKIFDLKKSYDGHAVESMLAGDYPSYKIPNIDYGNGFHVYDLGLVHYGSKIPKKIRQTSKLSGEDIVKDYTADKEIKWTKHPWAEHGPWKEENE
jgi:hypothetical protein